MLDADPDSCSLTCGTVNFGSDVFMNPWDFIVELYRETQALEIVPEFELFDLGHVAALNRLLDKEGLPYGGKVHCDLVLGVPGGAPGHDGVGRRPWPRMLPGRRDLVGHRGRPLDAAGGARRPVGRAATCGSAWRTRSPTRPGRPVRDNAELVERAATLATLALRPPMTTDEARALLNVKDRRNGVGA